MKKVLFSGYYGEMNTGDDAFCCVASWGAKTYWQTEQIGFFSHLIPQGIEGEPIFSKSEGSFRGQRSIESALKTTFSWPNVVFAGGSVFHDNLNFYRNYLRSMAKLKILNVGAIGVSLGPFKSVELLKENEKLLRNFSFLVLRDKKSFEIASEMNLPYQPVEAFDLAALMPRIYALPQKNNGLAVHKPVLGVSVCHYEKFVNGDSANEERREKETLRLLLETSKKTAFRVRLFVFNGNSFHGDETLTNQFAETLRNNNIEVEIVPYNLETRITWQKIAECDAVLAIRLHAAIFACFADVPFIMVEYHRKCTDFLNDVAYPQQYRVGDMTVDMPGAVRVLSELLETKPSLKLNLEALTRKAELSFTQIKQ